MKTKRNFGSALNLVAMAILVMLNPECSTAATWYVSQDSPTNGPGSAWSNAFHVIQDAVNVATNGDTVLVTNGTYSTGATMGPDGVTNVVYVTNSIALQSVSGPGVTFIVGGGTPSLYTPQPATARCVFLGASAALSGFTLTNGYSGFAYGSGGGAVCASTNTVITNCSFIGNYSGNGGGDAGGTLYNCTFTGNAAAYYGGGAYGAILYNCSFSGNYTYPFRHTEIGCSGGGASNCTLSNCVVSGNFASSPHEGAGTGGGAYNCTVVNSVLIGNSCIGAMGGSGAGAFNCTVINSVLNNNSCYANPLAFGGGVCNCTVINSVLNGNSVQANPFGGGYGGGAQGSTLINCRVTGNTATGGGGGGVYSCTLNDCLVNGNIASGERGGSFGGGSLGGRLNNCLISSNSADFGGGSAAGTLFNCTVVANTATGSGGGVGGSAGTLTNCIVFDNSAPSYPNYDTNVVLSYCCATPLAAGPGNISYDPQFVSAAAGDFHLQATSPCINTGISSAVTDTTDLDGNPRIVFGSVDLGAYEFQGPLIPPALTNSIPSMTVCSGRYVMLTAGVYGTPTFTFQWFRNGVPIAGATNAVFAIPSFSSADVGTYIVTVRNQAGDATSAPVTLTGIAIKMLAGFAGVVIDGPLGSNYLIEALSDLSGDDWMILTNLALPSRPYIYLDFNSSSTRQQFYRAVLLQ